jgi:Spy/CpxP family protein refolding chaperone
MKNRSSALAVIIAVLLIGCLLGMAGYHFLGKALQKHPPVSDLQRTQGHADRLAIRLNLTGEQEAKLKAMLEDSRRQIAASRTEWNAKLQDIRAKTNERIASILNEEQKKKFRQLLNEGDSHGRSPDQGRGHGDR